jgi:hypothetical protein
MPIAFAGPELVIIDATFAVNARPFASVAVPEKR